MRFVKILSIFLTMWLLLFVTVAGAVRTNSPAPDFSLHDLNGKKVILSNLKGRAVILNFWSTTCPPCVAELPSLNALYRDMAGHGLMVLGIALDASDKTVRELTRHLQIQYPVLMDSTQEVYFDSYALFGQPISILIDRSGTVQEKIVGQVDWASPDVRAKITNFLKGR